MLTEQEAEQLRKEILKEICDAYNRGFDCCRCLVNETVRAETDSNSLTMMIGRFIQDKIDTDLNRVYDLSPEDVEEDYFSIDRYLDSITVCDDKEKATA